MGARSIWTTPLALVFATALLCAPAHAQVYNPDPNAPDAINNDGRCSLREAIESANNGPPGIAACGGGDNGSDTIMLAADTYTITRGSSDPDATSEGDFDITSTVDIIGAGAGATKIDGNQNDRVFDISNGVVSISGVKITGGKSAPPADSTTRSDGGAIRATSQLTLTGVTITGNATASGGLASPDQVGGAGGYGGGVYSTAQLTIDQSTVNSNVAGNGSNGGPASNMRGGSGGDGGDGGGIYSTGSLAVTGSTITGNKTGDGGNGGMSGPFSFSGAFGGFGGSGGGIASTGTLTISGSTISGNTTGIAGSGAAGIGSTPGGSGGGGGPGGGVWQSTHTVSVTDTDVADNQTGGGGAGSSGTPSGGSGPSGDGGGLLLSSTTATVTGAAVTGNKAANGSANSVGSVGGAGGAGGGIAVEGGSLMLMTSTVTSNTSGSGGSGSFNGSPGHGGGVFASAPTTIVNSTIAQNQAGPGGPAGGSGGGVYNGGPPLSLTNVTIAGNKAGSGQTGGGIGRVNGSTTTLTNAVMSANTPLNCDSMPTDGGHDVTFPDATCPGTAADPRLGALGDNGGRTKTMALGPGSAALDVVPTVGANCPATDQRGTARPQGSACDAGAFELFVAPPEQPPGGGQPDGGRPGPGGTQADKTPPVVKLLLRKQKLRKCLRKGYRADFQTNEPGSATVDLYVEGKDAKGAKVKRKRIAHGLATFKTAGKKLVIAKFTKKAKKAFANRKKLRLLFVITVKDQAGNATKLTGHVTLKR